METSEFMFWNGLPVQVLNREWKSNCIELTVRFDNGEELVDNSEAFDCFADNYLTMEESNE